MSLSQRRWLGVPLERMEAWQLAFATMPLAEDLMAPCPVCGLTSLHRYYDAPLSPHESQQHIEAARPGGLWEWCSRCLAYEHSTALAPAAWRSRLPVDHSQLTAEPEALENARRSAEAAGMRSRGRSGS